MSKQIPRLAGTALLAVCIAVAACGDDGNGDGQPDDAEGQSSWLELLAHIPDTPETRAWVQMNDYAYIRERFDVARPAPDANDEELHEYLEELITGPDDRSRELATQFDQEWYIFPTKVRDELGCDFADIDQDITARRFRRYLALRGRFDEEAVDEAVHADPVFSDILEEVSYEGVEYYSWGEDDAPDLQRQTMVRPFGIGHRLALHDGWLYWTLSTGEMEEMIDARLGRKRSLADDKEYQLLAEGLDRLDTYAAVFSDYDMPLSLAPTTVSGMNATPDRIAWLREQFRNEPHLLPYQRVAAGAGEDTEGPFMALAVLHENEESAAENVGLLERRINETRLYNVEEGKAWADIVSDSEILSEGRLLLAKLYTTEDGFLMRLMLSQEPLLLYDDTAD